jgi:tetratricopeptide (TPR) repeat protein
MTPLRGSSKLTKTVSASVLFHVLFLTLYVGLLSKLQPVASGRYNAIGAPTGCLENTRVMVLDTLVKWAEDSSSTQYVYWLSGLAGTGKTAIMRTLCERLSERQLLGASFFISRAADNRRDARCILQTLIEQLAYTVPALRRPICDALNANPGVVELALELQLRALLEVPYDTAESGFSHPIVLVIDAFDECKKDKDSGRHGGDFLPLLLMALSRCQPYLKLVITSRLDQPILDMFRDANPTTMRLHEMEWMAVHPDMRLYLQHGFALIAMNRRLPLQGRWPTEDEIDKLVGLADKLFVYASTLLKYIGHIAFHPPNRLNDIIRDMPSRKASHAFRELDHLYSLALNDAVPPSESISVKEQDEIVGQLRKLLSILLVIQKPPSIVDLAVYVDELEEVVRLRLESVSAMVLVPNDNSAQDVRFFHSSFPDYLVDHLRCEAQCFLLDEGQCHGILLLGILKKELVGFQSRYAEYWNYHTDRAPLSIYDEVIDCCKAAAREVSGSQLPQSRYPAQHYLARVHRSRFQRTGMTADLHRSVELERLNLELTKEDSSLRAIALHYLGNAVSDQFRLTGKLEVLAESMQLDQESLLLRPPGHPDRHHSLSNLAVSLRDQFRHSGNPEALAKSEQLDRKALALRLPGHPDRHISLSNLAVSLRDHFQHYGNLEALAESVQLEREALVLRPPGHPDRHRSLSNLAVSLWDYFQHYGNPELLGDSVQFEREALALRPPGHPDRHISLSNLAVSLRDQFRNSGNLEALAESVQLEREALELRPPGHPDRTASLRTLALALSEQCKMEYDPALASEISALLHEALDICPPTAPIYADILSDLGVELHRRYRRTEDLNSLLQAVDFFRQALQSCHSQLCLHNLAIGLNDLASVKAAAGASEEAQALRDEAAQLESGAS